jgi:hypothetical protein
MTMNRTLFIAATLTLTGCASAPVAPLRGTPSQFAVLAGEWDGTYSSRATGRSGSIWFKLAEGEDHAHGDVLMTAAGAPGPYSRHRWDAVGSERRPFANAVLTIRFVRPSDGVIDGLLDPYWDPACECLVLTAFRGELGDGKVVGTFISRFGDAVATGRWEATRRRAAKR